MEVSVLTQKPTAQLKIMIPAIYMGRLEKAKQNQTKKKRNNEDACQ